MPNKISKHQVLAKLCIVTSVETWALARVLDRKPHSGWSNRILTFVYNPAQTVYYIEFPRTDPTLIHPITVTNL